MPVCSANARSVLGGLAVAHAAAGDDHRAPALADPLGGPLELAPVGHAAAGSATRAGRTSPPGSPTRRSGRPVGREEHRAGVGGRGEHAQDLGQRGDELLRPGDAVPVAADADGTRRWPMTSPACSLPICWSTGSCRRSANVSPASRSTGTPVDGRRGRARDHVRGARPDRAQARERLAAVLELRERDRGVDHRLLVAGEVVGKRGSVLLQRLGEAADVAMAEDPPHAGEERLRSRRRCSTCWFIR